MGDVMISFIADWLVILLAAMAIIVLLLTVPHRQKFTVYSRLLVAGLSSYFIAKLMSVLYQPADLRPFQLLGVSPGASYLDNPGFPSDHALFVWVLVGAIWYATRKPWLVAVAVAMAVAVSLGRVMALVHAPIDVVGGFFAAAIGAAWYLMPDTCKKSKSSVK